MMKIIAGFTLGAFVANAYAVEHRCSTDRFVQYFERHEGMGPGGTRIIPDIGSTIEYVCTEIHGNHYKVLIDKLD